MVLLIKIVKVIYMIRIESVVVVLPKLSASEPEILRRKISLVIKDAILPPVRLNSVVDVQTAIIRSQGVHQLTEYVKIAYYAGIIFKK